MCNPGVFQRAQNGVPEEMQAPKTLELRFLGATATEIHFKQIQQIVFALSVQNLWPHCVERWNIKVRVPNITSFEVNNFSLDFRWSDMGNIAQVVRFENFSHYKPVSPQGIDRGYISVKFFMAIGSDRRPSWGFIILMFTIRRAAKMVYSRIYSSWMTASFFLPNTGLTKPPAWLCLYKSDAQTVKNVKEVFWHTVHSLILKFNRNQKWMLNNFCNTRICKLGGFKFGLHSSLFYEKNEFFNCYGFFFLLKMYSQ